MVFAVIRRVLRELSEAERLLADPNPWYGVDPDLSRAWTAVDTVTPRICTFQNLHGVYECKLARYRHAAVEGAEYRGERP